MAAFKRNVLCACGRYATMNTAARINAGFPWRCARCFRADGSTEVSHTHHGAPLPQQTASREERITP